MEDQEKKNSILLLQSLKNLKRQLPTINTMSKRFISMRKIVTKKQIDIDISETDTKISQNFQIIPRSKTTEDQNSLKQYLKNHYIFTTIIHDENILKLLLQNFFYCKVPIGQYIIKQHDQPTSFFFIQKGKFQMIINGQKKKELTSKQTFGEIDLVYNNPRRACIKAIEQSYLWGMSKRIFKSILKQIQEYQFIINQKILEQISYFKFIPDHKKKSIKDLMILYHFQKGSKFINQHHQFHIIYILKSGKINILSDSKLLRTINKCQFFQYESNIMNELVFQVQEQCEVYALPFNKLYNILGSEIYVFLHFDKICEILKKSKYFSNIQSNNLELIANQFKVHKIKKDESINTYLSQKNIFSILQGQAIIQINNIQQKLDNHKLYQNINLTFNQTITFKQQGLLFFIQYDLIKNYCLKLTDNQKYQIFKQKASNLDLKNLLWVKKLGHGQFGIVYLVTNSLKSQLYAIKCMNRSKIHEFKLQKFVLQQKKVLQSLYHPFIQYYGKSFKDENYVYLLTEFINGMEMFDVIRDIGLLNSSDCKFYTASLILVLQYLHKNHILYRDLKPQNIMINSDGYIKLIDMGTCKNMKSNEIKTYTIIGTPHYMAPQIISGKGYSYYCDIWSLGICVFEFMCGYLPFGQDAEDPYQIYEQIIEKNIELPDYVEDKHLSELINLLLQRKIQGRKLTTMESVKNHNWFKGFNWNNLIQKTIMPPYKIPTDKKISLQEINSMKKFINIPDRGSDSHFQKSNLKKEKQFSLAWDQKF